MPAISPSTPEPLSPGILPLRLQNIPVKLQFISLQLSHKPRGRLRSQAQAGKSYVCRLAVAEHQMAFRKIRLVLRRSSAFLAFSCFLTTLISSPTQGLRGATIREPHKGHSGCSGTRPTSRSDFHFLQLTQNKITRSLIILDLSSSMTAASACSGDVTSQPLPRRQCVVILIAVRCSAFTSNNVFIVSTRGGRLNGLTGSLAKAFAGRLSAAAEKHCWTK
jgi:hypothetical protein